MLSKDFHPPLLLCPVMLRDMAGETGKGPVTPDY